MLRDLWDRVLTSNAHAITCMIFHVIGHVQPHPMEPSENRRTSPMKPSGNRWNILKYILPGCRLPVRSQMDQMPYSQEFLPKWHWKLHINLLSIFDVKNILKHIKNLLCTSSENLFTKSTTFFFWNRTTFLNKDLTHFRSFKAPFSGTSVKISNCRALVYSRPCSSVQFQSVNNRAIF